MENIYSGNEIVEFAVQIEKNGRDFYRTLTKQSKNQQARDIFLYLAGEEEKHIVVFQKLLDSVKKYEPSEAYPDEYFAYMVRLAKGYVFTKKNTGAVAAKNIQTDKGAVDIGVKFEKESILFFESMKKVIPEKEHNTLDVLIQQEQDHLKRLSDLKRTLK